MFKDFPKIELHLHLDGSVSIETAKELMGTDADLSFQMCASDTCNSLDAYLDKFSLPLEIMQTKENLERVAFELTRQLEKDHVLYAEVRFAPMLHTKKGLTMEEVVTSVLSGLRKGKVKTNLILCMMRGDSLSSNKEVIDLALKFLHKGVCAIDLAGSEAKYPVTLYADLFRYAKEKNIPFTIHAGEASSSFSVLDAIKMGAKRIGHGVRAIEDETLLKKIKDEKIFLEVCPTSNIQTNVFPSYEDHPVSTLFHFGICMGINTDNRTVSHITLTEEYEKLSRTFGFTKEDFLLLNRYAIEASFLSSKEKEELFSLFSSHILSL